MQIKFSGEVASVWMTVPQGLSVQALPEAGAFFAAKMEFSITEEMLADGRADFINEKSVALGIYETDKNAIALNLKEQNLELLKDVRLIDTRYGLAMYIKWELSHGKPQAVSVEHFLSMHSKETVDLLKQMCESDFFIFAYCDLHAKEVVRLSAMPMKDFRSLSIFVQKAAELIDSGKTYASGLDQTRAWQEVMAHVDKHPKQGGAFVISIPETTYG